MRFAIPTATALAFSLTACVGPALSQDLSGTEWHLVGVNGVKFAGPATILFTADKVGGQAPCNRWFGNNAATLPEIRITGIGATRMACDSLPAETSFFSALEAMQLSRLEDNRLYLTGLDEQFMEFAADPKDPCLSCLARQ